MCRFFAIYLRGVLAMTGLSQGDAYALAQCLALEFPSVDVGVAGYGN